MSTDVELRVPDDLIEICEQILSHGKSDVEWSEIESDDMLQRRQIRGYDAPEQAFCFSYYAPPGEEFWFQLTLG